MIPAVVGSNLPYLAAGLLVTLQTALAVMLGGILLGLGAGIVRASRIAVLHRVVAVYVEMIRGTPLLVVLFLVYFGTPPLTGVRLAAWPAAILGFVIFIAAYIAEDVRAGILAVPKGIGEAGRALGLGRTQVLFLLVLPMALRRMIPAFVNQFVRLVKFTSVASVIGVGELTGTVIEINARDFHPIALLGAAALAYLCVTMAVSQLGRWAARRLTFGV
jgi:His/Glu/Gln/Arg/opine family amino acid ABC transporter permease subunit